MNRYFQFLVLTVAFFFSIYNSNCQNPNPNSALDAFIQSEMSAERFPGLSAVIVKDGKIIWVESYGFADVQNAIPVEDTTVFLLASISKLFTGTASMHAVEAGILNLDANINTYLPFSVQVPGYSGSPLTIRQLMTHTSSINDNGPVMDTYYNNPDPLISLAHCMERYFSTSGVDYDANNNFINALPGSTFSYSNIATALSGFITESASGVAFDNYCDANLFAPMCMKKTAWHYADFDSLDIARPYSFVGGNYVPYPHYGFADYPSGQLRSNVLDLANFMITFLNNGTFGTNTILSASSINEMWTPQIPNISSEMGLNWYQEELFHDNGSNLLWGHNGGEDGVSTDLYVDPVNNIGICVLTNGEGDAIAICDELYNYALSASSGNGIIPSCATQAFISKPENDSPKKVLKVYDFLGREQSIDAMAPIIIIYEDGSFERRMK